MPALVKRHNIHALSLFKSSALSEYYVPRFIKPSEVIKVLNRAKVSFTLVGAHGIGGWLGRPRASEDVDVIVSKRHHAKAVNVLVAAFPHLEVRDTAVVVRLQDRETGAVAIDVMKPTFPIIQAALTHTHSVRTGKTQFKIPSLEMALALKFAAMVSPFREPKKKYMDASDFMTMADEHPIVNLQKLAAMGQLVYPGGGKEILEMVRRVRAGEKLEL